MCNEVRWCPFPSLRPPFQLMMPKRQPPPGCEPGEVRVARGSIYGTRDASRSWYQHFRDRLAEAKGLHLYEFNGRFTFVTVTHVDDLFYAYDTRCKTTKSLLEAIVKEFNMSRKQDDFVFSWQTRSCDIRSFDRQSRICGFTPCSDGIVWNPTIS